MINDPEVNCGIGVLPWTKKYLSIFATIKWFLVIACFTAIIQGSAQTYFNRTLHIWREEYGLSDTLTDWIIVANELAQGFLALFIINTSNKRQRIIWIAGTLAMFAMASFALLIPELVHPLENKNGTILEQFESRQICHTEPLIVNPLKTSCWTSLFVMFIYQIALGLSIVTLHIHSTLYIDDHQTTNNSIILIGIFLSFKELGAYVGLHLTWLSMVTQGSHIFGTPVWITLIVLLLICSGIFAFYPKYLNEAIKLKTIVSSSDVIFKPDLRTNVASVFKNKSVVLNILSGVFLASAIGNFNLVEIKFIQSKFLVANEIVFHGTLTSQIVSSIVKPLLVFLIMLLSGFLIAKFNIRGFYIGLYNSLVPLVLVIIFFIYLFLGCDSVELSETKNKKLYQDWCVSNCKCEESLFEPVCFDDKQTFFSPCYAGCSSYEYENGVKIFQDCGCYFGKNTTSDSCSTDSCDTQWLVLVSFRTVYSVLVASMIVGHMVLNLKLPHFTERSYVLVVEASLIGLIGYGVVRAFFLTLTAVSCRYSGTGQMQCNLYDSNYLGPHIIPFTIVLLICSSFCSFLMSFFIRYIEIYKIEDYMDIINPMRGSSQLQHRSVEKFETQQAAPLPAKLALNDEETTGMLHTENNPHSYDTNEESQVEVDVHSSDQPQMNHEVHEAQEENENEETNNSNGKQTKDTNKNMHETSL